VPTTPAALSSLEYGSYSIVIPWRAIQGLKLRARVLANDVWAALSSCSIVQAFLSGLVACKPDQVLWSQEGYTHLPTL